METSCTLVMPPLKISAVEREGLRLGASPFAPSEISGRMGLEIGIWITEYVW